MVLRSTGFAMGADFRIIKKELLLGLLRGMGAMFHFSTRLKAKHRRSPLSDHLSVGTNGYDMQWDILAAVFDCGLHRIA